MIAKAVWEEQNRNIKEYVPDCRFKLAMEVHTLIQAGFPIDSDDITLEQWFYIAELKNAIVEYQNKQIKKNTKHGK